MGADWTLHTWRHNSSNVGGVTAGQARHNSSNVGGVTAGHARHNSSNIGGVTAGQVGHNSSSNNDVYVNLINECRISLIEACVTSAHLTE